jgi:hypothetical protein
VRTHPDVEESKMSKNVLERMEEIDAKTKIANFMVKRVWISSTIKGSCFKS